MRTWFLLVAAIAGSAFAAGSDATHRYSLTGSGTLHADPPAQSGGKLTLNAVLQTKDAAIAALPPVQESGRFALIASVTAASQVCYNDTIFRDDFDGDGF